MNAPSKLVCDVATMMRTNLEQFDDSILEYYRLILSDTENPEFTILGLSASGLFVRYEDKYDTELVIPMKFLETKDLHF